MPRPVKWRNVCCLPSNSRFGPLPFDHSEAASIIMTVEEYETIRLIDLLELTQEQAAEQMDVARTTVQAIYTQARKKMAESLINGQNISIEGGNYRLCTEDRESCHKRQHRKQNCRRKNHPEQKRGV